MNKLNFDFGDMTQRISIFNVTINRDIIGGETVAKSLFLQCWAKMEPQRERQKYSNHASADAQEIYIYIRHQTGIEKQMQIEYEGTIYEIQSVVNVDASEFWLKIIATKIGDA